MYSKRRARPRSIAELQAASQGALDYYANLSGKPKTLFPPLPVPRKRVARTSLTKAPPKEHTEQVAFVRWFRAAFPGKLIFAIPNGGLRDPVIAWHLKQEGVLAAVPDLFCPVFRLFIEFKRVSGSKVPTEQKEMGEYLVNNGYGHFFAMGAEDGKRKTLEYLAKGKYGDY
jgi:hypothetical protein